MGVAGVLQDGGGVGGNKGAHRSQGQGTVAAKAIVDYVFQAILRFKKLNQVLATTSHHTQSWTVKGLKGRQDTRCLSLCLLVACG